MGLLESSKVAFLLGFACVDDLNDPAWDGELSRLAARDLGDLGINGWKEHWSRRWEFPWAYSMIRGNFTPGSHPEVVESGCGVTPLPFWLAGDGFRDMGIDLDGSCAPLWRSPSVPCRPQSSSTEFRYGDMLNLPLGDATTDVVFSVSAIEHTSDPPKAVSEMLRVLRPGGGIVITMDVDIRDSDSVAWEPFCEIVKLLEISTRPVTPVRHAVPGRMLTFENRTISPQSDTRLLMKRICDHVGIKRRSDQAVFGGLA